MNVVIIGAGTAGMLFAQDLRKKDKDSKITIIEQSEKFNYSPCSLPYYISNEINYDCLFNESDLNFSNIEIINPAKAINILKNDKKIEYEKRGEKNSINYDKLILALGSKPFIPKIEGFNEYLTFNSINDAKTLKEKIKGKKNLKIAIIGAGYIGCELADALLKAGQKPTIFEKNDNILSQSLSPNFSNIIKEELEGRGAKIICNAGIKKIIGKKIILEDEEIIFDELICCAGITPNIELAKNSGIKTDKGIIIDEYLNASENGIYAIGDCCQINDFFNESKVFGLASSAQKMAKILANNILDEKKEACILISSSISKIGEYEFGSAGKIDSKDSISATISYQLSKECFKKNDLIKAKIIANNKSEIIGAQIISKRDAAPMIDLISLAIKNKIRLNEMEKMDTCYNPKIAPIFNPIILACEACEKKIKNSIPKSI